MCACNFLMLSCKFIFIKVYIFGEKMAYYSLTKKQAQKNDKVENFTAKLRR